MIPDGDSAHFFHEAPLTGPLEELRVTVEKKARMHLSLGETAVAERLDSAYQIARRALEAALAAPPAALRAPSAPDAEPTAVSLAPGPELQLPPLCSGPASETAGENGEQSHPMTDSIELQAPETGAEGRS